MFFRYFPSLFLSLFAQHLLAQPCGCDHTLTNLSSSSVNIINATSFTYAPGDVFCVQADTVAGIRLVGFTGSPAEPLIFKNCGGKVVVKESNYSGIAFVESQYVHLTGTGDAQHLYGFEVAQTGGGSMGVNVGGLSSDAEIDHIEIHDTGFAGIMAKTDPNCNDSLTWRRNGYVLRNLSIHDNFIYDTEGEGMYLGYTGGYKVSSNKTCNGEMIFGHWLENVDVYDNIVENTGWDAIQLNLGRSDCKIHDNFIRNPGVDNVTFQNFAMSVGGGIYQIYNNFIFNDPGMPGKGMQLISGESGTQLYNNVFIDLTGYSLFIHNRHEFDDPNMGYGILNNTIIRSGESSIMYNSTITQSLDTNKIGLKQDNVPVYFHNNLIADPNCGYDTMNFWKKEPECYFDFNNKSTRDSQLVRITFNMKTRQLDTLSLVDTLANEYWPMDDSSPLVDAGLDLTSFGVTFDHNGQSRPMGLGYDIGAYEYMPPVGLPDPSDLFSVYPNPTEGRIKLNYQHTVASLTLYNSFGARQSLNPVQKTMDLTDLAKGMYWLRVEFDNGEVVVKKLMLTGQ